MSPLLLVLVGVAGGLGAVCRYGLDALIRARFPGRTFPWSTAVINVSGSLLLGLVVGIALGSAVLSSAAADQPGWAVVAGTGFLGGYTTFSTASVEAVQLVRERRWGWAAASAAGVLVTGTAAAAAGLWLGASLV
ncbi:fluoride efflux transporter FluC [Brevibacterium senegalense]|uniref:fluoride efflux transporter FluC n=1 Tax=Brevibacterium senegalense TaxID=1033736 RepID=UPI0002D30A43|nr:CrcB family protein [Brevibacterium senegalense]